MIPGESKGDASNDLWIGRMATLGAYASLFLFVTVTRGTITSLVIVVILV